MLSSAVRTGLKAAAQQLGRRGAHYGGSGYRFSSAMKPRVSILAITVSSSSKVKNAVTVVNVRGIHSSLAMARPLFTFNLPDVGERIATVVITEWLVKEGDNVSMGDALCEVQSDKSAATVYSPYDGVVREIVVPVDETAYLEKPLVILEVEDGTTTGDVGSTESPPTETVTDATADESSPSSPAPSSSKVLATPAVRHLAAQKGVDLAEVVPTGKGGRVVKEDILNYINSKTAPAAAPSSPPPPPPPPPPPLPTPPSGTDEVVPITGFKETMVRTMTESGRIPQFGYKDEISMDHLVQLRYILKARLAEKGVAFSYMPVLIKAVSLALNHHPILNSTVDQECTTITYRANHNVGVAMDTPYGLIVPNIKRVQEKTVFEIAVELNRLQSLGVNGQLPPADIAGGTFSLSNIGAIGGTYTNPMVLPPSVAIGAFGRVKEVPQFDSEGELVRSHVMHVSWSADHRVIDGAEVARFSNRWKSYVENPASMILEMK